MQGSVGWGDQDIESGIFVAIQNSNEHAYTFGELEKTLISEDPDIDLINLLLDLVQVLPF